MLRVCSKEEEEEDVVRGKKDNADDMDGLSWIVVCFAALADAALVVALFVFVAPAVVVAVVVVLVADIGAVVAPAPEGIGDEVDAESNAVVALDDEENDDELE